MEKTHFSDIRTLYPKYIIPDISKLLVLGCGELRNEMYLNAHHILGIDWADDRLSIANTKKGVIAIKYDIKNIENILVEKSFDCVAMFDFIEHLTKEDALHLLKILEFKIKHQIIIFVPVQEKLNNINNLILCQEERKNKNLSMGYHLSIWSPEELEFLGFEGEYNEFYHKDKNMGAIFCVKNLI